MAHAPWPVQGAELVVLRYSAQGMDTVLLASGFSTHYQEVVATLSDWCDCGIQSAPNAGLSVSDDYYLRLGIFTL